MVSKLRIGPRNQTNLQYRTDFLARCLLGYNYVQKTDRESRGKYFSFMYFRGNILLENKGATINTDNSLIFQILKWKEGRGSRFSSLKPLKET
jgi:hypothetical protein